MKKYVKKILILVALVITLLILTLANTRLISRNPIEQAKLEYLTTVIDKTYDVNNLVAETPNIPLMSAGMIPIKWNGESWQITTKDDIDWYNYNIGKPAYIMLNDGVYQSELVQDMTNKKMAKSGIEVRDDELGTIYTWIPRYAYNDYDEIIYLKEETSVVGTWKMPELFIKNINQKEFSLSGVWIEYKYLNNSSAVNTKINNINMEENAYRLYIKYRSN